MDRSVSFRFKKIPSCRILATKGERTSFVNRETRRRFTVNFLHWIAPISTCRPLQTLGNRRLERVTLDNVYTCIYIVAIVSVFGDLRKSLYFRREIYRSLFTFQKWQQVDCGCLSIFFGNQNIKITCIMYVSTLHYINIGYVLSKISKAKYLFDKETKFLFSNVYKDIKLHKDQHSGNK